MLRTHQYQCIMCCFRYTTHMNTYFSLSRELISEETTNPSLTLCSLGDTLLIGGRTEARPAGVPQRHSANQALMTPDAQLQAWLLHVDQLCAE